MQHTTKYNFNLIETSDAFSPEALNANAEAAERELARVEAALAADKATLEKTAADNKAALEAADAALLTAIGSGGVNARIDWGSYKGTGKTGKNNPTVIPTNIKPWLVIVGGGGTQYTVLLRPMTGPVTGNHISVVVTWDDRQVSFYYTLSTSTEFQCNDSGKTYYWIAIGESPE